MHWDQTQLLYHALGRLGIEALAVTASIEPYVCVGFSQGIPTEVDGEYCRKNGIGVFRREIGGGTVFIDRDQLLIQLVLRRDREDVPAGQANFFRKFLGPLQGAYRDIGVETVFMPVNDLLAGGRKISGTGGGEVGDCNVLATNLLLDFDFASMAGAIRCPSEEFRSAVRRMMERNLTTVRKETGTIPPFSGLRKSVRQHFEALLGPMEEAELPYQVESEMERIRVELFHRRWVSDRGARKKWREVKIREGCYVAQVPLEPGAQDGADGRRPELLLEVLDGRISAVAVLGPGSGPTGSFGERLARDLAGREYDEEQIINTMSRMATR